MKVKTSITLSEDLLDAIEERLAEYKNRSDFIEAAVREFLAKKMREERDARDLEILNRNADELNREAAETAEFQVVR
jgi:Arc/MetJ-type ribon-helix-helix transcriptional regulator